MFYTLFSINRTPLCFVGGGDGLIGAEREREIDHLLAKGGNSDYTFPQYLTDIWLNLVRLEQNKNLQTRDNW